MVWPCVANGPRENTKDIVPLEPHPWKAKAWKTQDHVEDVIQRDLKTLGFDWSVEEAEVATRDRALWRFLVGQAASAEMHDANR